MDVARVGVALSILDGHLAKCPEKLQLLVVEIGLDDRRPGRLELVAVPEHPSVLRKPYIEATTGHLEHANFVEVAERIVDCLGRLAITLETEVSGELRDAVDVRGGLAGDHPSQDDVHPLEVVH